MGSLWLSQMIHNFCSFNVIINAKNAKTRVINVLCAKLGNLDYKVFQIVHVNKDIMIIKENTLIVLNVL